MVLSVSGKIVAIEHSKEWWSLNLKMNNGFLKVIVESPEILSYKVGDHITAIAKHAHVDRGTLKMFSTPGLIGLVEDE